MIKPFHQTVSNSPKLGVINAVGFRQLPENGIRRARVNLGINLLGYLFHNQSSSCRTNPYNAGEVGRIVGAPFEVENPIKTIPDSGQVPSMSPQGRFPFLLGLTR